MSIGTASTRIAQYTALYDVAAGHVDRIQTLLTQLQMSMIGQPQAQQQALANQTATARSQLAVWTTIQGMAKEFLEYWKQVIKDFLAMIKSLQELAQGAR